MTLKVLIVAEEPPMEVSYVTREGEEQKVDDLTDMELPGAFTIADDLVTLEESACALESIDSYIHLHQGINLDVARQLDAVAPGFMKRVGGSGVFTSRPSLEGLAEATQTVSTRFAETMSRVWKAVLEMFKRFQDYLKNRVQRMQKSALAQEVVSFLSDRRKRDALTYLAQLPEDPAAAASEITRFVKGDAGTFTSSLTDQLQSVERQVEQLQKKFEENSAQLRLARGTISVEELFTEEADRALLEHLKEAAEVARLASMKTSQGSSTDMLMDKLSNAVRQLEEFHKGIVINETGGTQPGDKGEVKLDKLYDNLRKASDDLMRFDITKKLQATIETVDFVVEAAETNTAGNFASELMRQKSGPEAVEYGKKVAALGARIGAVGRDILRIWRLRLNALETLNEVGKQIMGLVDSFTRAVESAADSLSEEQRTQLATGIGKKGIVLKNAQRAPAGSGDDA